MLSFKSQLLISSSLLLVLAACESKKEDKKISYQYTINRCDTGAKTFDSQQAYCDSLINDAANNNCAREERLREHAEKCGGSGAQTKSETPLAGTDPFPRAPQEKVGISPNTTVTTTTLDTEMTEQPKLLTVTARSETRLQISPTSSGDTLITTLRGSLQVESIEPEFATPLRLIGVKAEILGFEDTCQLSISNFAMTSDNKKIDFTLVGTDKKSTLESKGCLAQLSTMAMMGFSVEFQNVPTANFVPQRIEKVLLNISNQ